MRVLNESKIRWFPTRTPSVVACAMLQYAFPCGRGERQHSRMDKIGRSQSCTVGNVPKRNKMTNRVYVVIIRGRNETNGTEQVLSSSSFSQIGQISRTCLASVRLSTEHTDEY